MKTQYFTLLMFCALCSTVVAQTNTGRPFFDRMHDYYLADPIIDTVPRTGAQKQYDRAFMEWAPRLWPHGDFTVAANSWVEYANEFHGGGQACDPVEASWEELGPIGMPVAGFSTGAIGVGQIHRITYDPRYGVGENRRIYAASSFGGLWVSENDGDLWTVLNTDDQLPVNAVADIAVSYQNEDHLFICTGNSDGQFGNIFWQSSSNMSAVNSIFTVGIYRSMDRGLTWEPINNGFLGDFEDGGSCRRMIVDPYDANKLYVATSLGIYRCTNALAETPEWEQVNQGINPDELDIRGLEFRPGPGNTQTLYCSGRDIYRSSDSGTSWTSITGSSTGLDLTSMPVPSFVVEISNIALSPADDNVVYALIMGKTQEQVDNDLLNLTRIYVFKYNSLLQQWVELFTERNIGGTSFFLSPAWMPIAASPVNANMVFIGGSVVRGDRNVDQAPSFGIESLYSSVGNCHADIHALAFQPNVSAPKLLAGHDGGMSEKTIVGTNSVTSGWTWKNNGLSVKKIWNLGTSDVFSDAMVIGTQDTGSDIYRQVNGGEWSNVSGGDGYGAQVLNKKSRTYLTMTNGTSHQRILDNGGLSQSNENAYFPDDPGYSGDDVGADPRIIYRNKSYKIVEHPQLVNPWICFTEIHERLKIIPQQGDGPEDIYRVQSDLGRNIDLGLNEAWPRQLNEFAIAESNPNYIYTAYSGSNNGENFEPQFFRSTQGGIEGDFNLPDLRFQPITQNLPDISYNEPVSGAPIAKPVITGIAIDPTNPSHLWLSFSGFDENVKVYESTDAGDTWVNADPWGSLANLPANDIVYQPGTSDRLYVATDAGVYYTEDGMECWARYGDIPNVRVTELEVNRCSGKLVAATFGRGVWQVDMLPMTGPLAHTKVIDEDETWTGDVYVHGNVRVSNGARLTVQGTAHFPQGGRLRVDVGSQLIVDGGTLTNSCGAQWEGVQVLGNPNAPQGIGYYPTQQGYLELKNGAVIENAITGVLLGTTAGAGGGGVIRADQGSVQPVATFRNCLRGVVMHPYQNFVTNANYPIGNRAYFRDVTFTVNDDLPGDAPFLAHVTMDRVYGINFFGCDFKNEQNDVTESHKLGYGIHSMDAGFRVLPKCFSSFGQGQLYTECPEPWTINSTFTGLDHGIHAYQSTTARAFQVENATFTNNVCGVYAEGVIGFKVVDSKFHVGGRDVELTNPVEVNWLGNHRGVFSTGGYGFITDDNGFWKTGPEPSEGLVVGYSGGHNDMVFNNHAHDLDAAYVGEGVCAAEDNRAVIGLHFQCNENEDNRTNLWSRRVDIDELSYPDQTIRTNQGRLERAADNAFDRDPANLDIRNTNNLSNVVTYWWQDPTSPNQPVYISDGVQVTDNLNNLPVLRPNNNCVQRNVRLFTYPNRDPGPVAAGMAIEGADYVNSAYLYKQLIDGGSTDEMVEEVMESWPSDVWDLRARLLSKSPYLSVAVLKQMVNKPFLPQAIKAEVCIANPDATKTEGFVKWMQEESATPMPESLVDNIIASWETRTFRTQLEATMAHHHSELTQNAHLLMDYYRSDTLEHVDSLRWAWQQIRTPAARYAEAMTYLQQDNFGAARNVILDMIDEHELRDKQEDERFRMLGLMDILEPVRVGGREYASMTAEEQVALQTLIGEHRDRAATWAQNLLCFHFNKCRAPLSGGALGGPKSRRVKAVDEPAAPLAATLRMYPNPASTYVVFEVGLLEAPKNGRIRVLDIAGRELEQLVVSSQEQQLVLDSRKLAAGTYTIVLEEQGAAIQTKTLVIR